MPELRDLAAGGHGTFSSEITATRHGKLNRRRSDGTNSDRLDMSVPFQPVNIAVMTVSDSRTPEDDRSGDRGVTYHRDGHVLADRKIITDDVELIIAQLTAWIEDKSVDVVITTGGTGLTGREHAGGLARIVERTSRDLVSSSASCPLPRSAHLPFSHGPLPAWRGAHISSRFPGHHRAVRMDGMIYCATSSISGTGHVTLLKSCRA